MPHHYQKGPNSTGPLKVRTLLGPPRLLTQDRPHSISGLQPVWGGGPGSPSLAGGLPCHGGSEVCPFWTAFREAGLPHPLPSRSDHPGESYSRGSLTRDIAACRNFILTGEGAHRRVHNESPATQQQQSLSFPFLETNIDLL